MGESEMFLFYIETCISKIQINNQKNPVDNVYNKRKKNKKLRKLVKRR